MNGIEQKIFDAIEDDHQHQVFICDYVLTGKDHLGNKTINQYSIM